MPFASEQEPQQSVPPGAVPGDEAWSRPADGPGEAPAAASAGPAGEALRPRRPDDVWSRLGPEGAETPKADAETTAAGPSGLLVPPTSMAAPVRPEPELAFRHHLLVLAFALGGGVLGIAGAFFQEIQAGAFVFLGAGVIEEALKPSGIYIVLVKWPYALRGRLYTAVFSALSGLVFGLLEAAMYVFVYFPDKGSGFVTFRFTVPLLLHSTGSFIFGLGINRGVVDWANGVAPFPKVSRNFFIAAMTLHASYNLVAVILQLSGVLRFD